MDFERLLKQRLPPQKMGLLTLVEQIAYEEGARLYLVGGAVRDLLLGQPLVDLDLVIEGDAETLAYAVAKRLSGQVVARSQFSTVKLKAQGESLDLVTARRERYSRPGALPQIFPGTIQDDLARRDFSINAMSIPLHEKAPGQLLDPFGGRGDLERGLVRVLHEKSFIDDATRILRAIRYEQRLGFHIEESTEALLRRDLPMLDTISGDRLRKELQLWLKEKDPLRLFLRGEELGVMAAIHPALAKASEVMRRAREKVERDNPEERVYVVLLAYALTPEEGEGFISRLRMPPRWATVVRDIIALKEKLLWLSSAELSPGQLYEALSPFDPVAVQACALAAPQQEARQALSLFLHKLRYVKPILSGRDLLALGIPQGPAIGEMLAALKRARLEGTVSTRSEEVALVEELLASTQR